ncbi:hypothetical protein [Halomarina oriensis]|uniref:Cox cluster protein n=1 Tax=Halomarina oriensis TaxID=671145 RepID=A0A6B0GGK1_9EURY|nr:hypothetical protein [Halomarina oriensis]MWG33854.1 hypothetical protein [Halomarina oriensis]
MRNAFWEKLGGLVPLFAVLFAMNVVLLVLLLISVPFQTRPAARTVSIIAFGVLSVSLVGTFVVIRKSRAYERREPSK